MPALRGIKRNFSGGIVSDTVLARDDLAKYATSCTEMKNFTAQLHGGARFRPGTLFVGEALGDAVMIPFEFNEDEEDMYQLVFTDLKMQVVQDDGFVISSGTTRVEITSPYTSAEAANVQHAQVGDVVYLAHPSHPIQKIVRTTHTSWTITPVTFDEVIDPPTAVTATFVGTTPGTYVQNYIVTSVNADGQESAGSAVGAASTAKLSSQWVDDDHITLTWTQETDAAAYNIYKELSGYFGLIGSWDWTTAAISIQNSTYKWTISASGSNEYYLELAGGGDPGIDNEPTDVLVGGMPMAVGTVGSLADTEWAWADNDTLGYTTIYLRARFGINPNSFSEDTFTYEPALIYIDTNVIPDVAYTPPIANNPLSGTNYPSALTFHEQRMWCGGSDEDPASFYASQTGDYENFNISRPLRNDDSLEFMLSSSKINRIKWMVPFGDLLIGTTGTEFRVNGATDGAITPVNVDAKAQSFWGSGDLDPITVGNSVLHTQKQGSTVRDLFYSLEKDGYAGNDLSVLANKLFDGYSLVSWAFQTTPDSILWAVRSDGVLLGMTFLKEHEIWGWHKHTTDGLFKDVSVIGGDDEDRMYAAVARVIGGSTKYFIEKLMPKWRLKDGIETAFYVDSGLTYDGAATQTVSGLDHLEGETLVGVADGSPVEGLIVTSGVIDLGAGYTASVITVGLPYEGIVAPLPFEAETQEGTTQGVVKGFGKIMLRLFESLTGSVGVADVDADTDDIVFDAITYVPKTFGAAITPFTGLKEVTSTGGYEYDNTIFVKQDKPLPFNLQAIIAEVDFG